MTLLRVLDLFGTGVFAVAGALVAGRKRMDIFGVIVVAMATAIGGGTIRDIVLERRVFWVVDPLYLYVAAGAAVVTFFMGPFFHRQWTMLLVADALGLAVFTVIGAEKALTMSAPAIVVVMMGVMTGAAGGIIRDVLCNDIPLILTREIYATASFAGATLLFGLRYAGVGDTPRMVAAVAAVLAIRLSAIHWRLALPVFEPADEKGSGKR